MQRAFLDIDIGSAQQHAVEVEEYTRAGHFLAAVGAQYGLPTNLQVNPPLQIYRCLRPHPNSDAAPGLG
jgi:hypothetical protein